MKIRNDFVTNSSSSNYVIAYKNAPSIDEETLSKYPWLKPIQENLIDYIIDTDNYYETETAHVISDIEDLEEYIKDEYSYSCSFRGMETTFENILKIEGEDVKKFYNAIKSKLDSGYKVMVKRVGYSDHMLDGIITNLDATDGEEFIILDSSEY